MVPAQQGTVRTSAMRTPCTQCGASQASDINHGWRFDGADPQTGAEPPPLMAALSTRDLSMFTTSDAGQGQFITLQTADRHPSKPDPSMIEQCIADAGADRARTVMIGDTVYDIAMACNAGVTGFGVDWGYHDTHELIEAGATEVATSVAHLHNLLKGIA